MLSQDRQAVGIIGKRRMVHGQGRDLEQGKVDEALAGSERGPPRRLMGLLTVRPVDDFQAKRGYRANNSKLEKM